MPDPDGPYVQRVLNGDVAAFEAIVERHRDVVHRVAARVVGPGDAEDVAQDAFLRAFHRLPRFRGDSTFRAWLLRITHNAALDAVGRRAAEPTPDPPVEDSAPVRTPAERLEQSERARRLESKLQLLRPPHRTAVVLRDVEGLSYEEIAQVTEAPVGSVKGWLHRGRAELVEALRRNTYDWDLPE